MASRIRGGGGGPRDDVGHPEPEGQQLLLLVRPEQPWGEARRVQRRPEPVAWPGEVVPRPRRVQPRVDAAEQHAQPWCHNVRHGPLGGGEQLGARRRHVR
jgi:hypothetical protein